MKEDGIKITSEEDAFGNRIWDKRRQGCSWNGGEPGGSRNKNPDVK